MMRIGLTAAMHCSCSYRAPAALLPLDNVCSRPARRAGHAMSHTAGRWQPSRTLRPPPHAAVAQGSSAEPSSSSSSSGGSMNQVDQLQRDMRPSRLTFTVPTVCIVAAGQVSAAPAFAEEAVTYQPGGGADTLKALAGAGYIVLVIIYFVRLFRKRAQTATSQRISSADPAASTSGDDSDSDEEDEEAPAPQAEASPVACFIAAAQAGVICYLLYLLSSNVDTYFEGQSLPTQYTARNITVLIQTIVRGLSYLITFIFAANTLGLTGLGLQLLLFPGSLQEGSRPSKPKGDRLPSVSVTTDIFELRRAFEEAERQGKRQAEEQLQSKD